jgi:hypothetical protein
VTHTDALLAAVRRKLDDAILAAARRKLDDATAAYERTCQRYPAAHARYTAAEKWAALEALSPPGDRAKRLEGHVHDLVSRLISDAQEAERRATELPEFVPDPDSERVDS